MARNLHPMHRKARHLYSRAELAAILGCSVATLRRLELSFTTPRQRAYLNAVGYEVGYYPRRKAKHPSP